MTAEGYVVTLRPGTGYAGGLFLMPGMEEYPRWANDLVRAKFYTTRKIAEASAKKSNVHPFAHQDLVVKRVTITLEEK